MSPDGQTDVDYTEINAYFPELIIDGGEDEYLTISNIPLEFNGWRAYAMFTNQGNVAFSGEAVTYVDEGDYEEEYAEEGAYTEEEVYVEEGTYVEDGYGAEALVPDNV